MWKDIIDEQRRIVLKGYYSLKTQHVISMNTMYDLLYLLQFKLTSNKKQKRPWKSRP